jgi:Lar family restriction alleviation protein
MTNLLPCPFCLCDHVFICNGISSRYVECPECGARGPVGELKADAVDAWNTRPIGETK